MRPSLQNAITTLQALRAGELYRGRSRFATGAPDAQSALDSVTVAWASKVPVPGTTSGVAELFDDARARWALERLGSVEGARCVELGPLEGAHSYMLERAGAEHVTAVEANRDAYLKCLVVKELLGLGRCSFLCGDVTEFLRSTDEQFDLCWCAGILYHMVEPVELLELISTRARRLYIWTHYYDAAQLAPGQDKSRAFSAGVATRAQRAGFGYTLHRHDYGAATRFRTFWGGTRGFSNWLELEDLVGALEHFGWRDIETKLDETHPHGPAVDLVARRG